MSKKYGSCALQRNELGTYGVHIGAGLLFLTLWATLWINPMRMVEGSEPMQTIWIAAIAVLLALLALTEVIRLRPTLRISAADWLLLLMLIYIVARSFLAPILDPTMVRTALLGASLYTALCNAEASYRRAYATLPARIYPLYLLFKLYTETDQPEKARSVGEELLAHRDKISSSATKTMRREVSEWLPIQSP